MITTDFSDCEQKVADRFLVQIAVFSDGWSSKDTFSIFEEPNFKAFRCGNLQNPSSNL